MAEPGIIAVEAQVDGTGITGDVEIGNPAGLRLSACGGNGGRGGDAGRGEDGGRGRSGSDATRFSTGDDGGPGAPGGDAGNPGDGGAGGNGGSISVTVAEADMDLLLTVDCAVTGGAGGDGGRGAAGGDGGPGGSGGSSYSWTETEHYTEWYTDANGKRTSRRATRTKHRRNRGGSTGRRGSNGSSSRRRARRGAQGADGTLRWLLQRSDGSVSEHASPYRLEIVGCTLEPVDQRLFAGDCFEPGERVWVRSVLVRNRGDMPSPLHQDVLLELAHDPAYHGEGQVALPRGIPAGAEVTVTCPGLACILVDRRQPSERPHQQQLDLRFTTQLQRVARPATPEFAHPVETRSPISIDEPQLYTSLAVGEASRWRVRVHNHSLLPFAGLAARGIRVHVASTAGDADLHHLRLVAQRLDRSWPYEHDLDSLGPGENRELELLVGWRDGAETFRGRELDLNLAVTDRRTADWQNLQCFRERLQVASAYRPSSLAKAVVIVNHGVDRDAFTAWQALLTQLGIEADVLDLSYEGSVDLDAPRRGQTLRKAWQGRLVLALNNIFEAPSGDQSCADYLFDRQVLAAWRDNGIGWVLPGTGRPLFDATAIRGMQLADEHATRCAPPSIDELPLPHDSRAVVLAEISGHKWFGRSGQAKDLIKRARALMRRLAVAQPWSRHLVVWRSDPQPAEGWWLRRRWQLGSLEVRTVAAGPGAGVSVVPDDDARVLHPAGHAAALTAHLFRALPLRELCKRMVACLDDSTYEASHRLPLLQALLLGVALERERVGRSARWRCTTSLMARLTGSDTDWLPSLTALCEQTPVQPLGLETPAGQDLAQMIGRLLAVLRCGMRWYDLLRPGLRDRRLVVHGQRQLRAWCDVSFADSARAAWRIARLEAKRLRNVGAQLDRLLDDCCPLFARRTWRDAVPPLSDADLVLSAHDRERALARAEEEDRATRTRMHLHAAEQAELVVAWDDAREPPPFGH